MKQIIIALAMIVFGCSGAKAQEGCKTPVAKHKRTVRTVSKHTTTTEACRIVPFEVCSINADRRSVTCYKTTDNVNFLPQNDVTTTYGPEGKMPGEGMKPKIKTVVIKGESKGNFCRRDVQGKTTTCYYVGNRLWRDKDGYYHNR
jgi:hypothetical protein